MRKILDLIADHYRGIEYQYAFFSAVSLFMIAAYRVSSYFVAVKLYPELSSFSFVKYFALSAGNDLFCAAAVLGVILLLVSLPNSWRLFPFVACNIFVSILALYLIFSIQFMRIYETAFVPAFVGGEQLTGIKSMLTSAAAEISVWTVAAAASAVLFIFAGSVVFLVIEARTSLRSKTELVYSCAIIYISLVFFTALAPAADESHARKLFPSVKAPVGELAGNPVSSIFFRGEDKVYRADPMPQNGFDSSSLDSSASYDISKLIPKGKKYNIVIYLFESTAYKYYNLSVDGVDVVPQMHRLAANGMLAKNHIVNYPLSANALYSITTGEYPMIGKKMVLETRPKIQIKSLTEILKESGYRTCYIHSGDLNYAGQRKFLSDRKIDRVVTFQDLLKDPRWKKLVGWGTDERSMIDPALQFAKESSEPFVMILSPMNPHHPYAVPDDSYKIFKSPQGATRKESIWYDYLNSLHFADAAMGQLVQALEDEGLMKNTLFFMIADHGEAFYQHNMNYNHPLFLYEENVHVPFILYNRDIFKTPAEFSGITRHIDILPTILDILQIPDLEKREGVSIFSPRTEKLSLIHTSWKDDFMAVRDVRWKYIMKMKDGSEELYDLSSDPDEKNNVSLIFPDIAARYRDYTEKGIGYINGFYEIHR